jgi:hypothetical protein
VTFPVVSREFPSFRALPRPIRALNQLTRNRKLTIYHGMDVRGRNCLLRPSRQDIRNRSNPPARQVDQPALEEQRPASKSATTARGQISKRCRLTRGPGRRRVRSHAYRSSNLHRPALRAAA